MILSNIEFIEKEHKYLVNGIIVPSVTTVLGTTIFKDMYANVPDYILKNKANYGTRVHDAILYDTDQGLTIYEKASYQQWKKLQKREQIEPLKQEIKVAYKYYFAGTFDMIAMYKGRKILIDFKTTYKLEEDYLAWQLSMYKLAYEHRFGEQIDDLYAIWLPKGKIGKLIKIDPIDEFEVIHHVYPV